MLLKVLCSATVLHITAFGRRYQWHIWQQHTKTMLEVEKLPTAGTFQKPLEHIWIGRDCYWVIQSSCLHCSLDLFSYSKAIPDGWVSSLALKNLVSQPLSWQLVPLSNFSPSYIIFLIFRPNSFFCSLNPLTA